MGDGNVIITPNEMYTALQEVSRGLQRIEGRLDKLESRIEMAHQADERSREALEKAKDAHDLAKKLERKQEWIWRALVSALATGIVGVLFYLIQN